MPDTGKMKRLFQRCTKTIMDGDREPMAYPEGDLDGIAEQIGLHLDRLEQNYDEAVKLAASAEHRTAQVIGEVRRAHKSLDGALKASGEDLKPVHEPWDPDEDEDEDETPTKPPRKKPRGKPRQY